MSKPFNWRPVEHIVEAEYENCTDIDSLALKIGCSVSTLHKKASRMGILRNQECIERAAMRPVDTSGIVPGAIACRCPLELAWLSVGAGQPRPAAEWVPE